MNDPTPQAKAQTHAISSTGLTPAGDLRGAYASPVDDRRFYKWLLVATAFHALFLISFASSKPRRLGNPDGAESAISVDFISEADLKSRSTVADSASGAPKPPPPPPAQARAPTPPPTPAPPPEARPQPATEAPPPLSESAPELKPSLPPEPQSQPPAEQAAEPKPVPPQKQAALVLPEPAAEAPAPSPTGKASPAPPAQAPAAESPPKVTQPPANPHQPSASSAQPPAKPAKPAKPREETPRQPTQTAKLDLSVPSVPAATFSAAVGSGTGGVERPPGITRSGLNDEFARGVIRALQRTMPQLSNTLGRVTVRIVLNMNGNLVTTTVIRPSNVAGLDQNVVFATRQSSFPLPPGNSKPDDLIFFVTYIYR